MTILYTLLVLLVTMLVTTITCLYDLYRYSLLNDSIKTLQIPFYEQIYNVWNNIRQNPDSKWQYLEQIIWKIKHIHASYWP